jgi:hypothetical protein
MDAEPYLIAESLEDFQTYTSIFCQRHPKYGLKAYAPGASWRTINKPLHDDIIKKHLNGLMAVGTVAQWYAQYGVIDIDDRTKEEAEAIRAALGFDTSNSLLIESESPNSWHLYFRPTLNGRPPPITRFNKAFRVKAKEQGVEIYPQKNRIFRLAFGRGQEIATTTGFLFTQVDQLHEFLKLEPFDITQLEMQKEFDFQGRSLGSGLILPTQNGFMSEAQYLYAHGLQAPSTRQGDGAQFKVAVLLYRAFNLPPQVVEREVYKWLKAKNNGYSKDIVNHPEQVKREIKRQVYELYSSADVTKNYPDVVHNAYRGFLAKDDLPLIVEAAGGSLPRCKFLFEIVKFFYPRKYEVNLSSKKILGRWGSPGTYYRYTQELEEKGLVTRGQRYRVADDEKGIAGVSKSFQLHWPFKSPSDCFFIEGRSVDTFQDYVKFTVENPLDFRELLQAKGAERTAALKATRSIYS